MWNYCMGQIKSQLKHFDHIIDMIKSIQRLRYIHSFLFWICCIWYVWWKLSHGNDKKKILCISSVSILGVSGHKKRREKTLASMPLFICTSKVSANRWWRSICRLEIFQVCLWWWWNVMNYVTNTTADNLLYVFVI